MISVSTMQAKVFELLGLSKADDWQDAIKSCFTGGPRYTRTSPDFNCHSLQCLGIEFYLNETASLIRQYAKDEKRIRERCEPAIQEFCRAIIEAKQFLKDCSEADLWKNANSIFTKLHSREAYDVLFHNLIWSKAGLLLAIDLNAAQYGAQSIEYKLEIMSRVKDRCTSELSTHTGPANTETRLNEDRHEFYSSVEKYFAEKNKPTTRKKCLTFLVEKSEAYQKFEAARRTNSEGLLKAFEIDPKDINDEKSSSSLGDGSYGKVYKRSWLGQTVAVKVVGCRMANEELFKQEASVLAGLHNPFIVHMVGWCKKDQDFMLVMELVKTDLAKVINDSAQSLTVHAAVDIMMQIAKGMEYLHEKGTIHRDIKPSNVLLEPSSDKQMAEDGHARVKLCDFGLAKVKKIGSRYTTLKLGTAYYRAPEVLLEDDEGDKYTTKADVFSFAITCAEILAASSATDCYADLHSSKALRERMLKNVRPTLPKYCPSHLAYLIKRCWDTNPERRPPFTKISNTLTYIKFILMRVSRVERVFLYDSVGSLYESVVSPFDEDELIRRLPQENEEFQAGKAERRRSSAGGAGTSGAYDQRIEEKESNDRDRGFHEACDVESRNSAGAGEEKESNHDKRLSRDGEVEAVEDAEGSTTSAGTYRRELEEESNIDERCFMKSRESLQTNHWKMCKGYKLIMQTGGILVLYTPPDSAGKSRALWATHTRRDEDCTCVLEEDGNLVIYDSRGRHPNHVVWSSNSGRRTTANNYKLELESDQRAVIRGPEGTRIWATDESVERTSMKSGQFLVAHQWMLCQGYRLIMQGDGNLVIYHVASNKALWASGTHGAVCICKLEEDGNLVIYDISKGRDDVVWSSNRRGPTASYKLELHGRRAVIQGPQGQDIWATDAS